MLGWWSRDNTSSSFRSACSPATPTLYSFRAHCPQTPRPPLGLLATTVKGPGTTLHFAKPLATAVRESPITSIAASASLHSHTQEQGVRKCGSASYSFTHTKKKLSPRQYSVENRYSIPFNVTLFKATFPSSKGPYENSIVEMSSPAVGCGLGQKLIHWAAL